MRRITFLTLLIGFALAVAGCFSWPSNWRPFGSPLDQNAKAEAKLDAAQGNAIGGAQAAVHKATAAIAAAPQNNRAVAVTRDFLAEAQALIDQAHGAPNAADEVKWRALVDGLLSENAEVRAAAERQHAIDSATTADLAHRLAAATANAQRSTERALEYAHDREGLADFAGKLKLGFFALVGLLVLGTALSIASRFFPAFGVAAKLVNGIVAPGLAFVAHRAETGLQRVGQALTEIRPTLEKQISDRLTQTIDANTDADHQRLIAAGAATTS